MTMKQIDRKITAVSALAALALVAMPSLASAHGGGEGAAAPSQSAHMSPGPSDMRGHESCPMETTARGMTGRHMGGSGMMGSGMMGQGKGAQGMMGHGSAMDRGHGMKVVPSVHLSTDDVRHFLDHRLAMHGNQRLKVGEVKEGDDDTIVADIVTLDDSLVQRFEVDRHSGRMKRVE